ncbi:hypothetical protein N7490_011421 [Penicillium lividum]|nr:hypothetical protein N7490_011421 [Penicillium lividum]
MFVRSTTGMDTVAQLEQDFIRFQHVVDAGDILIGSHVLICSLMMNVLTEHPDCIIPYVSIWALMVFLPTLPLGPPFYLSTVSFTSIVIAVLMSMVAISLGWTSPHLQAFPSVPTIQYACVAVADIVFTYVGYAVFFLFSDLEDIDVIPNALVLLQTWEAILYKASAIAIHAFVGNEAITLALGAVGKLHRQISISYGVATPVVSAQEITFLSIH